MKAILVQSEPLVNVLTNLYNSRIPGAVSKKVLYMVLEFEKIKDQFVKSKQELQNKYGEKTETGELKIEDERVIFTPENRLKFNKEFEALANKDHNLGLLTQSDIEKIPNITSAELKILLDASLISDK